MNDNLYSSVYTIQGTSRALVRCLRRLFIAPVKAARAHGEAVLVDLASLQLKSPDNGVLTSPPNHARTAACSCTFYLGKHC